MGRAIFSEKFAAEQGVDAKLEFDKATLGKYGESGWKWQRLLAELALALGVEAQLSFDLAGHVLDECDGADQDRIDEHADHCAINETRASSLQMRAELFARVLFSRDFLVTRIHLQRCRLRLASEPDFFRLGVARCGAEQNRGCGYRRDGRNNCKPPEFHYSTPMF